MSLKLFDSELKVMEVLWKQGDLSAGKISKILKEEIGWNRNTTYTVIKKCIEKEAIKRYEPNFMCKPMVSREKAQQYETRELIDKMFDGSTEKFFAAFIGNQNLSSEEIEKLKGLVTKLK
ncbi:BlaI/MecI/CopY family transcriptional regulator [Vallitalea maricola]|uniref:BlaI/MecI/CopY family transcriptional regulator n=1 Tax=Vallitalea maricola TaxID=3074433 RepID=A0ACB5UPD3_9FIRM|nr:BlaI/MecI/CopY family transcriptional regulator [Vallitalea sp. AN17-2]